MEKKKQGGAVTSGPVNTDTVAYPKKDTKDTSK